MVKIENDCCGCATGSYPCLGNSCPRRNVKHYYCDKCEEETVLYELGDSQLCVDCVLEQLDIVKGSE